MWKSAYCCPAQREEVKESSHLKIIPNLIKTLTRERVIAEYLYPYH